MTAPRQQVLICVTSSSSLRSECTAWSCEDGSTEARSPVGMTPGASFQYDYETVRHAMGDGWFLLGPPVELPGKFPVDAPKPEYEWWLSRTVVARN